MRNGPRIMGLKHQDHRVRRTNTMMIAPSSFVEMEIKGKTQEEALKAVQEIKDEIIRLEQITKENNGPEYVIHPTPEVKISVYNDYLDAAKEYFKTQGWDMT